MSDWYEGEGGGGTAVGRRKLRDGRGLPRDAGGYESNDSDDGNENENENENENDNSGLRGLRGGGARGGRGAGRAGGGVACDRSSAWGEHSKRTRVSCVVKMSQTGQSESKLVKRGARARASQGGDLFEREAREVAGPHEAHHLLEVLDEAAAHVDLRNLSVVEIGSSRSNLVELVKLGGIGQTGPRLRGPAIGLVLRGWAVLRACAHSLHSPIARSESSSQQPPPSPPLRTKWTRRVPHPVLIGHATNKPQRRCVEAHLEIDAHTGLVRLRDLRRRRPGGEEHVHAHQRVWLHRPDRSAALQLF